MSINQEQLEIARARAMGFLLGLIEYNYIPARLKDAALDILREYKEATNDELIVSPGSRQQHDERHTGVPAEGLPRPPAGLETPG